VRPLPTPEALRFRLDDFSSRIEDQRSLINFDDRNTKSVSVRDNTSIIIAAIKQTPSLTRIVPMLQKVGINRRNFRFLS
jgi:5,10-methylenetetrahydrofolate reductase